MMHLSEAFDAVAPALPPSPIVVLDSGLGGLTVVRALRAVLPAEDVVYFGDTARFPYGSKSAASVSGFVRQMIAYLRHRVQPKHIVIACNTATALALPALTAAFPDLSISGVIDPGAARRSRLPAPPSDRSSAFWRPKPLSAPRHTCAPSFGDGTTPASSCSLRPCWHRSSKMADTNPTRWFIWRWSNILRQ